ncbi:hypothetical protein QE357_002716 [Siphonobacter sp. BAB-5404]|nr:hypothetical protein [Siphonobacter sp. SORGH_AS_0500]
MINLLIAGGFLLLIALAIVLIALIIEKLLNINPFQVW